MKKLCMTVLLILILSIGAMGNDYRISWDSVDGGGSVSSGSRYSVVGVIGQPDAGGGYNEAYEIDGGYWPGRLPRCIVDLEDLAAFAAEWLTAGDVPADLNDDQTVDISDFAVLANAWLYYCPEGWSLE